MHLRDCLLIVLRGHPQIHLVKNGGLFPLRGGGSSPFPLKMTSWIRKKIAIKVDQTEQLLCTNMKGLANELK